MIRPAELIERKRDGGELSAEEIRELVLGYTRDEILGMSVLDIARSSDSPMHYDEMLARGARDGISILTTKDGRELEFAYAASRTRVARLEMFVAVGFVVG